MVDKDILNNLAYGILGVLMVVNIYLAIKMHQLSKRKQEMREQKTELYKDMMKRSE